MLRVRFSSGPIRFAATILYPLEVKRQLATPGAAAGRAVELARQIIQRRCYRPPDLDTLACALQVAEFDLKPFTDAAWNLEDGTRVYLVEAE